MRTTRPASCFPHSSRTPLVAGVKAGGCKVQPVLLHTAVPSAHPFPHSHIWPTQFAPSPATPTCSTSSACSCGGGSPAAPPPPLNGQRNHLTGSTDGAVPGQPRHCTAQRTCGSGGGSPAAQPPPPAPPHPAMQPARHRVEPGSGLVGGGEGQMGRGGGARLTSWVCRWGSPGARGSLLQCRPTPFGSSGDVFFKLRFTSE